MIHANDSVLARMTKAGWIQSARNDSGLLIEWTEAGGDASRKFRELFDASSCVSCIRIVGTAGGYVSIKNTRRAGWIIVAYLRAQSRTGKRKREQNKADPPTSRIFLSQNSHWRLLSELDL